MEASFPRHQAEKKETDSWGEQTTPSIKKGGWQGLNGFLQIPT